MESERSSAASSPTPVCLDCRLPLNVLVDGPLGTIFRCSNCHGIVMVPVKERSASQPHE
jgi:hypothetical protein